MKKSHFFSAVICALLLSVPIFAVPVHAEITLTPTTNDLLKDAASPTTQIEIPGVTFSEEVPIVDEGLDKFIIVPFLGEYITGVYKYGVIAAAVISVIMLIVAGVLYTVSGGSPDLQGKSKKLIANAVTGLIIAVGSYTILYTINPDLVKMTNLKIKYVDPIDLDELTFDKNTVFLTSFNLSNEQLDTLFQTYAKCFGYDWRILKAVAAAESGLNPNAQRPGSQYAGLFQMNVKYCSGGLQYGKYPKELGFDCANRIEPETNTATAAATINWNLSRISKACPHITVEDAVTLLYVGHNNGPGVMNRVISDKSCSQPAIRNSVQNAYVKNGGKIKTITTEYGLKKHDYGRDKVVSIINGLGVPKNSPLFPPNAKDLASCPITTKERVLKNTCDPVDSFSCSKIAGKKILALGDSNTESPTSYAKALQSKCPGIDITIDGHSGKSAGFLYDQIKNRNLRLEGFTDIIVWAGVNNIVAAKNDLAKIYDKATQDGLRIIAISVTPWKGYGSSHSTPEKSQEAVSKTHEVNDWMRAGANGKLSGNNMFIDAYSTFASAEDTEALKQSCTADKIHLNANAQSILGDMVAKAAFN